MNDFAKPLIVLVCTGNTCRSPMAEGILKQRLAAKGEDWKQVNVISAGVAANDGAMAAMQAIEVMEAQGIDISCHASRPLSDAIMHRADVVLTMTRGHRAAILAAWPEMANCVHTLRHDGGDIADPVGGPVELYEQCAAQIASELDQWLAELGDDFLPQLVNSVEGIDKASQSPHDQSLRENAPRSTPPNVAGDERSDDQESV